MKDDLVAQVLGAAARFDAPSGTATERMWASVQQRVVAGDPGPTIAEPVPSATASGLSTLALKVLGLVGGMGLLAAAVVLGQPAGEEPRALAVQAVDGATPSALEVASERAPIFESAAPPAAPVRQEKAPSPAGAPAARVLPPPLKDSLAAEVELLGEARVAAKAGRHREALGALRKHLRRFASGTLWRERDLSRVDAHCALRETDKARAVAAAMLRKDSSDVLEIKLRKTCVGAERFD